MLQKVLFFVLLCLYVSGFAVGASNVVVFKVSEFGAVGDGKIDDSAAIRNTFYAAVKHKGAAKVIFEPKTYRLGNRDDRWETIDIVNADNVEIDGNGAMLIFSPNNRAFLVENSKRITIRNFFIDYNPLPFTQGDVVSIDHDNFTFDMKLHDGFPTPPSDEWMVKNTGYTGNWRHGVPLWPKNDAYRWRLRWEAYVIESVNAVSVKDRIYRIKIVKPYQPDLKYLKVGDQFLLRVRYPHANLERSIGMNGLMVANFRITASSDCLLENICQYCAPNMSINIHDNDGLVTIRNYKIKLKPNSKRLTASFSDGVHVTHNKIGPIIEDCYFEGLLDDSINIGTMTDMVIEVRSPSEFVTENKDIAFYDHQAHKGDRMLILNQETGQILGEANVVDVKHIGTAWPNRNNRKSIIKIDKKMPKVKEGTHFYNLTWSCANYRIRNNTFVCQNRCAMLIQAPDGIIENNYTDSVGAFAVWLTNDTQYFKGPIGHNTIIRNNKFTNHRLWGAILAESQIGTPEAEPILENVLIENNLITYGGIRGPGLLFKNVKNLTVKNNEIRRIMSEINGTHEAVSLQNCRNIKFQNNRVFDQSKYVDQETIITSPETGAGEIKYHNNTIKIY